MSKKRQRRELEAVNSYESALAVSNEESALTSKDDDELFVLDRSGSKNTRRKFVKEENAKLALKVKSKTEQLLIERIAAKNKSKTAPKSKAKSQLSDIWGEEDESEKAKARKRALKIPQSGFSYNPSSKDHQDVVAEVRFLNYDAAYLFSEFVVYDRLLLSLSNMRRTFSEAKPPLTARLLLSLPALAALLTLIPMTATGRARKMRGMGRGRAG
jgi:hypothetical protein